MTHQDPQKDGIFRWVVLALCSALMFGNYYAYDLPSSLNKPLQQYLDAPDTEYNFNLGLFYSLYSFPNIILPLLGGWVIDAFGPTRTLITLSSLVFIGQFFFALGISIKVYWVMHLGRVIFGIGGESLGVAQSRIAAAWFMEKELALALSINLSVGRLGSVFNDLISPRIGVRYGMHAAFWLGTVMCLFSLICAALLSQVEPPSSMSMGSGSGKKRSSAVSADTIHLKSIDEDDDVVPMSPSFSYARNGLNPKDSIWKELLRMISFPAPFWLICGIMCAMYATVIPFNTIHAGFLQSKWYPTDPETAGQVMSVPDTISAILVTFAGSFVDRFGRRVQVLFLCGILMTSVHIFFAFATPSSPSPLYALCVLGFSYSLLITFWPCIPLVVQESRQSIAFGFATSLLNTGLTLFPLIVSHLVSSDPSYMSAELFFVACNFVGVLLCVALYLVDRFYYNGLLETKKLGDSDTITLPTGHAYDTSEPFHRTTTTRGTRFPHLLSSPQSSYIPLSPQGTASSTDDKIGFVFPALSGQYRKTSDPELYIPTASSSDELGEER